MIVAAGLIVAGMGSLALVILALHKAPEGYEDEHGFHAVRKGAMGYSASAQKISRRVGRNRQWHRRICPDVW